MIHSFAYGAHYGNGPVPLPHTRRWLTGATKQGLVQGTVVLLRNIPSDIPLAA